MRFTVKIEPFFAALSAAFFLFGIPAYGAGPGGITNGSGAAPRTVLVEQPQDALRLWQSQGQKNRAVLLISQDLPLNSFDEQTTSDIIMDISEGRWDNLTDKGLPSVYYYPINRSSYLYIASKLGLISRIYWVPPTKDPVDKEPPENLNSYFRAMGVTDKELGGLKRKEGSITGTLNGIPVQICNLRDIPGIDKPVIIAVDLSFFGPIYLDEVRTPFLDLLGSFMSTLSSSGIKATDAVISYSTGDGTVPLEQRFIGGYLQKFLTRPGELADGPPVAWRLRSQGMYHDTFFQVDDSLQTYKKAVDVSPDDASLRYDLALAYFSAKDIDRMKEELDKAVSLDKGYYTAYITYGRYFATKQIPEAAIDFLREAEKAGPDDPKVWEAMHDIQRASLNYAEAIAAQKKYIALGFNGPVPTAGLAQDYYDSGDYGQAVDNYLKALGMLPEVDADLRPQYQMKLAEAYEKSGKIQQALDAYKSALDSTLNQHSKMQIMEKYDALKKKWAPFMKGGD